MISVTKRVAVAPFELKLGPHESYGRATSVKTPPGPKKAQKIGSALSASVLEPSLAHGSALLARLSSQCGSAAAARKRAMVGNGATRARGSRELKRRTFDKRTQQAFPESARLVDPR